MPQSFDFTVRRTWDESPFKDSVTADSNEHAYELMLERYPTAVSIKAAGWWCFISNTLVPVILLIGVILYFTGILGSQTPTPTQRSETHTDRGPKLPS